MNKKELVEQISQETGLSKKDSLATTEALLSAVAGALGKGDTVTLVGFGTFKVTKRQARTGRNPQTGAEIKIPAKNAVKFKAGKELQEKVNK